MKWIDSIIEKYFEVATNPALFTKRRQEEFEDIRDLTNALRITVDSLQKIRSGLTTEQSMVEKLTKAEAHDALLNVERLR